MLFSIPGPSAFDLEGPLAALRFAVGEAYLEALVRLARANLLELFERTNSHQVEAFADRRTDVPHLRSFSTTVLKLLNKLIGTSSLNLGQMVLWPWP